MYWKALSFIFAGPQNLSFFNVVMIAVGAAWGFRTPRELVESGAAVVIDAPPDLLALRPRATPGRRPP